MKNKTLLPSRSELLKQAEYWRWQALTMKGQTSPWLMMPGLVVYMNTDDLTNIDIRIEVLSLALKQARRGGKNIPDLNIKP